jgi:hypothetical protein
MGPSIVKKGKLCPILRAKQGKPCPIICSMTDSPGSLSALPPPLLLLYPTNMLLLQGCILVSISFIHYLCISCVSCASCLCLLRLRLGASVLPCLRASWRPCASGGLRRLHTYS